MPRNAATLLAVALATALIPGTAFAPVPAAAQPQATELRPSQSALASAIDRRANGDIGEFYKARKNRPLWVSDGLIGSNAQILLRYFDDAPLDGLNSNRYDSEKIRQMIARADRGDASDLARAELELTKQFARYVRDMRDVRDVGMIYADPSLEPKRPDTATILRAATIRDFGPYLQSMGWMSEHYVRTRELLRAAHEQNRPDHIIDALLLNRERARILPSPAVRHIVVDASSAELYYYQQGKRSGTMKVVVGATETQTPLMAGSLTWAIVNPYWNVPDYLVRSNVARKINSGRTLKSMNMEVLADWSPDAVVLDQDMVDWKAVEAGGPTPRVRELPGRHNSMGKVKFLFPNDLGIYLHDTPNRDLFTKSDRHVSNGCIRLEHAQTLGRWMMGDRLDFDEKNPETPVFLPAPVPVYLTYLTAIDTKDGVGLRRDVYGRDGE